MAMTEVAQATVTIIPNMKGAQAKIAKDMGASGGDAGNEAGLSFGKKMIGALGKIGIAAAAGKLIKDSIDAGAALQQSFGGLDTLYEDASAQAKEYAYQAAQAGISANDYAEQAVSFGAALKQAFEGDTAAAAEAANTAILDMADNAAKMGTDISSIQTAYQGFAKGNYTMLDNLKLGYGGTKEEMERLLSDAEKLPEAMGKDFDLSNLGDVYEAIHLIQDNLGIAGVAAEEAATTLSGSFGAVKASFQNLLADMSLGNSIAPDLEALGGSIKTFLTGNLMPMIGNVLSQLPTFLAAIPGFVADMLPELFSGGVDIVTGLVNGIVENIPVFLEGIGQLLTSAWDALVGFDWTGAGTAAVDLLGMAWEGLKDIASGIWDAVVGYFTGEIDFPDISGTADAVWSKLVQLSGKIWTDVVTWFTSTFTWPNISNAAQLVWDKLTETASSIWNSVVEYFTQDISWTDIGASAKAVWDTLGGIASGIWDTIVGFFTQDIEWKDISAGAEAVWNALETVASTIWDAVVGFFTQEIEFPSLDELAQVAWGTLETVASGVWAIVSGIFSAADISFADLGTIAEAAWETLKTAASGVWDFIKGIFGAADITFADIGGAAETVWNGVKDVAGDVWEGVKGVFGAVDVVFADLSDGASKAWGTLSTAADTVWNGIKDVFGSFEIEWPDFGALAQGAFDKLKGAAQGVWDWIKGLFGGSSDEAGSEAVQSISGTTEEMAQELAAVNLKVSEVDISTILLANKQIADAALSWKRILDNLKLKMPHIKTGELVTAKNTISSATSTYKKQMQFAWNLPTLHGHLPIISATMNYASSSDGKTKVAYPSINVTGFKWFAEGGIFNEPTVIGIGDSKGPEAAVPLDEMWRRMSAEFDKHANSGASVTNYFNVDGAQDPELWAQSAARTLQRELRMA